MTKKDFYDFGFTVEQLDTMIEIQLELCDDTNEEITLELIWSDRHNIMKELNRIYL